MQRLRFRFTIRFLMFAIAATAISIAALVSYREHLKKVKHYRAILVLESVVDRSHFSSAQAWRDYLEDLRRAEEYLGIPQQPDERAARTWTDEDERRWPGKVQGIRIIPDVDEGARQSERLPITSGW